MAIFHLSIKIVSRSKGKSAVAASAYRAGEKLTETETGYVHVSMPFLFCMFSPFKKCSFLVKKILLIKQCIDSFLFFFHEFFPFF